jgi:uncharacterized membrane protein
MKIVKRILIVIAVLIAIPLILALFTKKDYAVERSIVINKPKQEVFNYVKHLRNQDNFSVWTKLDPEMKKEFRGTDGTEGFVYAWDSQKGDGAGAGEQKIVKITEGESVDMNLHFIRPFEGLADARFTTTEVAANQTKVTWGFKSSMKYPMNAMLLFMDMDKILGKDLATGLKDLKAVLEKQALTSR